MSTRSRIAMPLDTGFLSIYCHNDGYPQEPGVGWTLSQFWTDPNKVAQLIALGDISVLGEEIGEKHGFNEERYDGSERANQIGRWVLAYGRDRDEKDVAASRAVSMVELFRQARDGDARYLYLFDPNSRSWSVCLPYGNREFVPIKRADELESEGQVA